MNCKQTIRVSVLLTCATITAAVADSTNQPAVLTKTPAQPQDYRLMLDHVRAKQQEKNRVDDVQKAIQAFQMRYGRLPDELSDLVTRGVLTELPAPPDGTRFSYDRLVGNISLVPAPGSHGATNVTGSANVIIPPKWRAQH